MYIIVFFQRPKRVGQTAYGLILILVVGSCRRSSSLSAAVRRILVSRSARWFSRPNRPWIKFSRREEGRTCALLCVFIIIVFGAAAASTWLWRGDAWDASLSTMKPAGIVVGKTTAVCQFSHVRIV